MAPCARGEVPLRAVASDQFWNEVGADGWVLHQVGNVLKTHISCAPGSPLPVRQDTPAPPFASRSSGYPVRP